MFTKELAELINANEIELNESTHIADVMFNAYESIVEILESIDEEAFKKEFVEYLKSLVANQGIDWNELTDEQKELFFKTNSNDISSFKSWYIKRFEWNFFGKHIMYLDEDCEWIRDLDINSIIDAVESVVKFISENSNYEIKNSYWQAITAGVPTEDIIA